MVRFGPAGNSESFYAQGHKHTKEAFAWIAEMGLNAYEYSFGHGARIREETACEIGAEAAANGVVLSVHAPYYINLATLEEDLSKRVTCGTLCSRHRRRGGWGQSASCFTPDLWDG